MAAAPKYKVFTLGGDYIASCKYREDAAVLVAARGKGATVRLGHSPKWVIWREGSESQSAGHSYDYAANVMAGRESGE